MFEEEEIIGVGNKRCNKDLPDAGSAQVATWCRSPLLIQTYSHLLGVLVILVVLVINIIIIIIVVSKQRD